MLFIKSQRVFTAWACRLGNCLLFTPAENDNGSRSAQTRRQDEASLWSWMSLSDISHLFNQPGTVRRTGSGARPGRSVMALQTNCGNCVRYIQGSSHLIVKMLMLIQILKCTTCRNDGRRMERKFNSVPLGTTLHWWYLSGRCARSALEDGFCPWTFCFALLVQFPPQLTSVFFPKKRAVCWIYLFLFLSSSLIPHVPWGFNA